MIVRALVALCTLCLWSVSLPAQVSLDQVINAMDGEMARAYFAPFLDGWTHSVHLGQYGQTSSRDDFDLYAGFQVAFFVVPDDFKSYTHEGAQSDLATFFGSGEIQEEDGELYPGGYDFRSFPLYMPQLRIGNIGAFDFGLTYSNYDYGSLLGNIRLIGAQVRCSVDDWMESEDFAWSVGASYHHMDLTERVDAQAFEFRTMIGLQREKYFVHAFGAYFLSEMKVTAGPGIRDRSDRISISIQDPYQVGIGGGVQIWKFLAHSELSVYPHRSFAVGLGLNI